MSLLGEATYALITPSYRSIGFIIPDVVIEESIRDELIVTQHPVEIGAQITDHAFKRPVELEMRCGWSDSSAGYVGYIREVYQALQALQASRQPFTVSTGKRRVPNVLIRSLTVATDPHTENVLMVSVSLQEVILVSTSTTGTGTDTTAAGSSQADPATTGSTSDLGTHATADVSSSGFNSSFSPGAANAGVDTAPTPVDGTQGPMIDSTTGETLQPAEPGFPDYNPFPFNQ